MLNIIIIPDKVINTYWYNLLFKVDVWDLTTQLITKQSVESINPTVDQTD